MGDEASAQVLRNTDRRQTCAKEGIWIFTQVYAKRLFHRCKEEARTWCKSIAFIDPLIQNTAYFYIRPSKLGELVKVVAENLDPRDVVDAVKLLILRAR